MSFATIKFNVDLMRMKSECLEDLQFAFSKDNASCFFWGKSKSEILKTLREHRTDFVQFYKVLHFPSLCVSFLNDKPESTDPMYKVKLMTKYM